MMNKIDSSLQAEIKCLSQDTSEIKFIVFTNNLTELITYTEKHKNIKILHTFDFINAVIMQSNSGELLDLSVNNFVDYITSDANVFTQMNIVREILNIKDFHNKGITGKGKTLAIIDTGIQPHLDFLSYKNRIIEFKDIVNSKTDLYDDNGHGTFICGVATGNGFCSGRKYCGIAPDANIIMIKALDSNGQANAYNILSAMEWIYNNSNIYGINTVCMSFGSSPLENKDPLMLGAEALWNKNICVVAAAGNSGPLPQTIKSPGTSSKIITVGALDDKRQTDYKNFEVADFSSRGPAFSHFKPDILSSGVNLTSTSISDFYTNMSGTSVATPIVAGCCLLLMQKYPDISPAKIKNIITKNAISLNKSRNEQGFGALNKIF